MPVWLLQYAEAALMTTGTNSLFFRCKHLLRQPRNVTVWRPSVRLSVYVSLAY